MLNNIKNQCSATSKRNQAQCKNPAMPNGKCRMHSGGALRGAAHPRYVHGRYSKAMPRNLIQRFANAETDSDWLNLKSESSLLISRIEQLLPTLETASDKQQRQIWAEIFEAIEKRRKLTSTALVKERIQIAYIPTVEVVTMVNLILTTIKQELDGLPVEKTVMMKLNLLARQAIGEIT